jgi:4-aminobutyrate aminotransferase-like enzyme
VTSPPAPAPPDARLARGDLLPELRCVPPGPRARALARELRRCEAPGVDTVRGDELAVPWAEACGANVLDVDGNRYLDLTAGFGVAAVGHRHPRVVAAVVAQSRRLLHGLGDVSAHPARVALARRLVDLAPFPARVYFAVSGADAIEIALKTALLATGRPAVLAFSPSYHGLTLGALAASSREAFRAPFAQRLGDWVVRLPFGCPEETVRRTLRERPDLGVCLVEPIVGREGVLLPPPGWLERLGVACAEHGVLRLADEVFTGFGRAGERFVSVADGFAPDLLCLGKALGGGLPLAAVLGRSQVLECWPGDAEALHTATFLAHPLACAAALAALDVIEEEGLVLRARRLGAAVEPRLRALRAVVRGRGLLWGLEAESAELAHRWVDEALRRGVLALAGGEHGTVLQVVPPLTMTEAQLDCALGVLAEVVGRR